MPAFLSKLKKKILNEVDDAKDFSTKKALGGFDFVRDIATRPDYKAGGSKAFEYMNALSDMGTGAATYRFADPVKDQNGNLRADFSWKSFGRGFTSPFGNQNKWESEFEKQGRDDNSFRSAFSLTKAGGKYWDESNLPTGAKVAGDFALDPSMYIPAGTIGRLSAKAGLAGTRFGRVALGGATKYDDAGKVIGRLGASSRSARIAGGFLEGAGRNTLGMSAGAGLLSEGASRTPWEGDDYLASMAGGIIGGAAQGLASRQSAMKNNVIKDKSGDVFRDLYTHIEKEPTLPRVAPGEQWKQVLNAKGVTKRELEWNGLDDEFFNRGKVTREEILNKIKENDFDIEETILGPSGYNKWHDDPEIDTSNHKESVYENYTVPGGDKGTYREILLRQKENQPEGVDPLSWKKEMEYGVDYYSSPDTDMRIAGDDMHGFQILGAPGHNSMYKTLDEAIDETARMSSAKTVNNQWEYEQANDGKNILAHIRVDDRDKGRTLFVHEIQSDWAQENRSGEKVHVTHVGASKPVTKDQFFIEETKGDPGWGTEDTWVVKGPDLDGKIVEWTPPMSGKPDASEIDSIFNLYGNFKIQGKNPHPFQKNWQELALKRILRYAADEGYDRVQLASGEQTLKIPGMQLRKGSPEEAGRLKSYNEMLPNKLNDIAKKFDLKVEKINSTEKPPKPIGNGINIDDFGDLIRDPDTRARLMEEWGAEAYTDLKKFKEYWLGFEEGAGESLTFDQFIEKIYEQDDAILATALRQLATKVGNYLNMPFKTDPPTKSVTLDITPQARGLITSKPQTMFSIAGDEQIDPNTAKRLERQQRLQSMQEPGRIPTDWSKEGRADKTKFMTQGEKSAEMNLATNELSNTVERAVQGDQTASLSASQWSKPTSESPSFRITDKLRQRYTSAVPIEPIQNIPTEEMPTLKTHLQELIWGMDDASGQENAAVRIAGGKKSVGETAREKFTLNQFEKPKTPPIGDYRLRAEELLNELSDEELNMPVANLEVADLIASIVGGRDMEKILSQRALEAKAYRESTTQLPATIMRDQAPPPGMGGTVANSNKVPYQQISDPNTEIAAIEQIQDQIVLGGSGTPPTPGAPTISFLDPGEQIASLKYLAMPRRLSDAVEDVKTWTKDNVVVKALTPIMGLVNPSVLLNTKVGRVITARTRQELAVNELSTNALSVFDRFNGRLGIHPAIGKHGTVFSTNDKGIVKGLNMHWNDIFADIENLKDKLTPQQYEYAKTFNDIIDDVRILRTVNLLPNLPRDINGRAWVPRTVRGIDNIEIIKPTNHRAKRYWELATEGVKEGVDYADPRETLKLYLRETYNEIIKADFAHEMQKITESTDTLVNPLTKKKLELATAKLNSAKTDLKFAAQQWRADRNNPDLTKIYETMKQKAKDAYIEQLKAKTGMEKALEAVKAQESNRSYRILEDGTKEPIDTYKINKIGERVVSREDAKLLRNYIGVNGMGLGLKEINESPVSRFFGVVGRTFRTTTSTLDAATPFIHTLPVLAVRPKAWVKAMGANYWASVSPRWRDSYATKNLKYINEMANYNIAVGSNEYFEAIGGQGDITKALNKTLGENSIPRKILRGSGRQTVGRMEAAMSTNLLVARTELWKALREDYAKDNNLAGLAQFVRNITGALDSRALMVGKGQRDQESFWLAFSPKLVRSTFALGAMALNPTTKEGRQAAKALSIFLGGVLGTAYLVNLAFNPDIDPLSEEALSPIDPRDGKKFMASKTPIGYIGIGGQIRAAMQLFGKSADALWRREPGVFLSNDQFDNPIMSWYMGRGAPGIQFGQDVIEATTGANANPYTEITSPSDFFKTEAVNFLPFFAQNMIEAEDMKSGALAAGIGSFGPRFAPFSPTEVRNHRIEAMGFMTSDGEVAKELDDLNREQKKEFFEKFPVEKITKEDNVTKMFNQIDQEEISYNSDIALMSLNVQRGTMSKVQFREWLNERTSEKYAKIDQIKSTFSVLPADRAGFEGSVTEYISSKNTRPEDRAVSDYYEASSKVPLKPNGEVDYDGIKAAKQRVLDSLTPEQRQYVTKMVTPVAQREENELVTEYDIVKEITQPYFQSDERIFEYFRRSSGFFSQFNSYEAYQSYIDQTAAESGITSDTLMGFMSKTIPDIKLFDTLRTEYKRIQRLQDPNLDRALTEWYGMEPANRYDYLLSGMGSDAGAALSPAIAADKGINNGNAAAAFALKLRSSGDYKPVKRKFYRPQRSLT